MQQYINTVTTRGGAAVSGASVLVKTYPGGVTATIYSDDGVTATTNPLTTDANGEFTFYAADGRYSLTISKTGVITQRTITDIILQDPDDGTAEQSADDVIFTPHGTVAAVTVQEAIEEVIDDLAASSGASTVGFVQSGNGAIPRTMQDKGREVLLSVTDYGVAVGNSAAMNSAALANAVTEAESRSSNGGYYLHFPGNATAYSFNPIDLDALGERVFLVGDGPRASRLSISGGSTGAGTYGVNYSASDTSFGGLRRIGVTAAAAYESVLRVNEPHNQFMLEKVYLDGASLADYALRVDGGSQFFVDWIYTTGLLKKNFYFKDAGADTYIQIVGGNHDIGAEGIALIDSTTSGGALVLTGGRFETQTSKDLFQYQNLTQATQLRLHGVFFTSGAANSIIRVLSGSGPTYHISAEFNGAPTNVYLDDGVAADAIAVTDNAERSILESSKVFYRDVRMRGTTGADAKLRFKRGTQSEYSIYGGSDSNWYFRDETNTRSLWLASSNVGLQMQSRRIQGAQGADIASASAVVLGNDGNRFRITGTTTIDRLSSVNWQGGATITLHFTASLTVTHGATDSGTNRGLKLAGAVNFSATADDQLTLQYDATDTKWIEICRTVI